MKTLKKIGIYLLRIAQVVVLCAGLLILAIFAPKHLAPALIEGVEKGKKAKKKVVKKK